MDEKIKKQIDSMDQEQMAIAWRFAKVGDPLLKDEAGVYFAARFKELGGMTPKLSKKIGW